MYAKPANPAAAPDALEAVTHLPFASFCNDLPLSPLFVILSNTPAVATLIPSIRLSLEVVAPVAVVPTSSVQAPVDLVVTSNMIF